MKTGIVAAAFVCCHVAFGYVPQMVDVRVEPTNVVGRIKPLNGVNNAPRGCVADKGGNFYAFREAGVSYVRCHDAAINWGYGGSHVADVTCVFPDFDADVDDPASYDFTLTDNYVQSIVNVKAKPLFRLGQSIEHWPKKYGVRKPRDFAKWARICEHIIRHYNEGWADGLRLGIRHWEIWNEADLKWPDCPDCPTWDGTEEEYHELYRVTARHLKSRFPDLLIGGPACAGFRRDWIERFVAAMARDRVPMDFFSWHQYTYKTNLIPELATFVRQTLDANGFTATTSVLDEWGYNRNFGTQQYYSGRERMADDALRAASFMVATLCDAQNLPIDLMCLYDARPGTTFNVLWDMRYGSRPLKGYWALCAWRRMLEFGAQVKVLPISDPEFRAVAALRGDGRRVAVLVSRYRFNQDEFLMKGARIDVAGSVVPGATVRTVDFDYDFQTLSAQHVKDGKIEVYLEPCSFTLVEMPLK